MSNHLGFLLHGLDEDFARLVVDEGDKVEEILVRTGGEHCTNIRKLGLRLGQRVCRSPCGSQHVSACP